MNDFEIDEVREFFNDQNELFLFTKAVHYQKLLMIKFGVDQTSIAMGYGANSCYLVSARLPQEFGHRSFENAFTYDAVINLIVYQDCIRASIEFERNIFEDVCEDIINKAGLLARRTAHLKEIEFTADESILSVLTMIPCGLEQGNGYSRVVEETIKEELWLMKELHTYAQTKFMNHYVSGGAGSNA